jgi:beta-galactosidase
VLTDVEGSVCGVDVPVGEGRCILLAAQMPSDPAFFGRALAALGVRPGLRLETQWPGVFATTMSSANGERTLHLINTSGAPARVTVGLDGTAIASGVELVLPSRCGHILPLGLSVGGRRIDWASAEIASVSDGSITFRPGVDPDAGTTVVIDGEHVRLPPGEHVLA